MNWDTSDDVIKDISVLAFLQLQKSASGISSRGHYEAFYTLSWTCRDEQADIQTLAKPECPFKVSGVCVGYEQCKYMVFTESGRRTTACQKGLKNRHPRQPLFGRQTAELHFKAENSGASCEHILGNIISQHSQLIDSAGDQMHADCSFLEQWLDLSLKHFNTAHQSVLEKPGPSPKPRHWIIKGHTKRNKGLAAPSGLQQSTCWLGDKAPLTHPHKETSTLIQISTWCFLPAVFLFLKCTTMHTHAPILYMPRRTHSHTPAHTLRA